MYDNSLELSHKQLFTAITKELIMKKVLLVCCFIMMPGCLFSQIDFRQALEEAIEKINPEDVRKYVKKLTRYQKEKKVPVAQISKLWRELQKLAGDKTSEIKKNIRISNSYTDISRIAGGLFLIPSILVVPLISLTTMKRSDSQEKKAEQLGKYAIFGIILSIAGVKLIFDGYNCKSQQSNLNKGRDIELLISDRIPDDEGDW